MKLSNIFKEITHISEEEQYNHQNYMSALPYIDKLYKFINILKVIVPMDEVKFLPSYKDINISQQLGLDPSIEESSFHVLILQSPLFFGDMLEEIKGNMIAICYRIVSDDDVVKFYLN